MNISYVENPYGYCRRKILALSANAESDLSQMFYQLLMKFTRQINGIAK